MKAIKFQTTQSILNQYEDLGKLTEKEKNNLINSLIKHCKQLEIKLKQLKVKSNINDWQRV